MERITDWIVASIFIRESQGWQLPCYSSICEAKVYARSLPATVGLINQDKITDDAQLKIMVALTEGAYSAILETGDTARSRLVKYYSLVDNTNIADW